jgi:hypothetical protein
MIPSHHDHEGLLIMDHIYKNVLVMIEDRDLYCCGVALFSHLLE